MKRIGIIGGYGAAAGVHMAGQLVALAQQMGAVRDEEFPEFMLISLNDGGMTEKGVEDGSQVRAAIKRGIDSLAMAGCEKIIIACNSAHRFLPELELFAAGKVELLDMVKAACEQCVGCKTVGILCSESASADGIYEKRMAHIGVMKLLHVSPRHRQPLSDIIARVISGEQSEGDASAVLSIMEDMRERGAERIIIGCTELPILLPTNCQEICTGFGMVVTVDPGLAVLRKAMA